MSYLERSRAGQCRKHILAFQQAIIPFKLTRMEALALVNTPPNSLVEVHLLVEECEERLKGDEIWALLNLCRRLLLDAPVDQPVDMEASGMDGAADGVGGQLAHVQRLVHDALKASSLCSRTAMSLCLSVSSV